MAEICKRNLNACHGRNLWSKCEFEFNYNTTNSSLNQLAQYFNLLCLIKKYLRNRERNISILMRWKQKVKGYETPFLILLFWFLWRVLGLNELWVPWDHWRWLVQWSNQRHPQSPNALGNLLKHNKNLQCQILVQMETCHLKAKLDLLFNWEQTNHNYFSGYA